jgi:hypothetical protein
MYRDYCLLLHCFFDSCRTSCGHCQKAKKHYRNVLLSIKCSSRHLASIYRNARTNREGRSPSPRTSSARFWTPGVGTRSGAARNASPCCTSSTTLEPPRPGHSVRYPEAAGDGAPAAPAPAHRPFRKANEPDSRAQRRLERRLKGAVSDGRRPLLSAHRGTRDGWTARDLSIDRLQSGRAAGRVTRPAAA